MNSNFKLLKNKRFKIKNASDVQLFVGLKPASQRGECRPRHRPRRVSQSMWPIQIGSRWHHKIRRLRHAEESDPQADRQVV